MSAALAYVDVSTGEFAVAPFVGPEARPRWPPNSCG